MEHFFQKYKKPLIVGGGLIVASWVLVALLIYSLFTKQQEQFDKRRNDFYERSVKVKNERNKRHKEFSNAMDNMMASTSKSFQESDQRYKESRARDAIDSEHSKRWEQLSRDPESNAASSTKAEDDIHAPSVRTDATPQS